MKLLQPFALALALALATGRITVTAAPVGDQGPMGVTFVNNHPQKIFIGGDWAAKDDVVQIKSLGLGSLDRSIEPGETTFYPGLSTASPKFMLSTTPLGLDTGDKRSHDTAVELSWGAYAGKTYYDVDVERGTSVPIWCHGNFETWDQGEGCVGDVLADCPPHLVHVDPDTGKQDQCIGEDTPADIARRAKKCPGAFVVATKDETHTMMEGQELKCWILDPANVTALA